MAGLDPAIHAFTNVGPRLPSVRDKATWHQMFGDMVRSAQRIEIIGPNSTGENRNL
jgi:hypothetical protein